VVEEAVYDAMFGASAALNVGTAASVVGAVGSVTGAVGSVTGSVGSVTGAVGSVTGAVGSVTATTSADIVAISGDATAAVNLESYCDGTTPMPVNLTQWIGVAPLALTAQRVEILVGAIGAATITAAAVATDAIDADALAADAVAEIVADIMTEIVETEGNYTVQQVLSVALSVLAGETSGGGATLLTPNGVGTRVAATTDVSNNRTAMTVTPSS